LLKLLTADYADQGGFLVNLASAIIDRRYSGITCLNSVDAESHRRRYDFGMTTSTFRIVPLATEVAQAARRAAANGAPDHAIIVADSPDGFPCRHCLQFAQPGERVIVFSYAAIPAGHPYSESGPIFVHAEPCERYSATKKFPTDFRRGRVMRAYNSNDDMIDAEVVNGTEPEAVIEKFLQKPETAFVDARSVTRGCYTFRIQRL
jgi:hypothetical protein